jgi:hypothetical protein
MSPNCRKGRKLFIPKPQYTAEGRRSVQKINAALYVHVLSEGQITQPPTSVVDQVDSERGISTLHILNRQHF